MNMAVSLAYFLTAGLCEIGGGYLVWLWLREGKSVWLAVLGALVSCPPRGAAPCPPLATGPGAPPTSGLDHGRPLCSSRLWTPRQGGRVRPSRGCVRGHRRFPVWDEDPGRGFQAQDHHHPHQTKGHGQQQDEPK